MGQSGGGPSVRLRRALKASVLEQCVVAVRAAGEGSEWAPWLAAEALGSYRSAVGVCERLRLAPLPPLSAFHAEAGRRAGA